MKLGLVSAILGDLSFEEMIDFLAGKRFSVCRSSMLAKRQSSPQICRSYPY